MPLLSRSTLDPVTATSICELRVRFSETDLMGIVHHAAYLPYFEVSRVHWLRRRGITYRDWAASGLHLPVVDASCKYLKPAFFDDVLHVHATADEMRTASLRFSYVIYRGEERVAEGMTRHACVNAEHRPIRMPPAVVDVLRASELPA